MSATATLKAVLLGEDRSMSRTFDKAGGSASGAGKKIGGFGSGFIAMGAKLATGIGAVMMAGQAFGKLTDFVGDSIKSLGRIERINAQTEAAIKSTGGAAGVTAEHVEQLAGNLENLTATEAEATQEGANLLLTFTKIRNEAGKGNDIFDQTTVAMVDMARAMGQEPRDAAIMLGKALNDPVAGITALTRAGVQFTDEQKETIKTLVESGDVMGAQKIILAELTTQFGKSGEAFAATTEGKIELAKHALGTLGETIMAEVLPSVGSLATSATTALNQFSEDFAKGEGAAGALRDAISWLQETGSAFAGWVRGDLWPVLKDGYSQIMPALRDAWNTINSAVGENESGWRDFGKVLTTQVIPFLVKLFTVYIPMLTAQWLIIINTIRSVWGAFQSLVQIGRAAVSGLIDALSSLLRTWAGMLRGLSKIPGFGWAGSAADKLDNAADQASRLAANVRNIPSSKTLTITTRFLQVGNPSPGTLRGVQAAYATGGPVISGRSYLVGENGPELFTPDRSGSITDARNTAKAIGGGSRSGSSSGGGSDKPIIVQLMLDGRMVQEVLVDRKRALGGMPLGLA